MLSEIDASLFVLDYVANADAERLRRTLPNIVKALRRRHPATPIAFMSGIMFSQCHMHPGTRQEQDQKRDVIIHQYSRCRRAGDMNIHFVDGNPLFPYGANFAYSDIGVHPSSAGFQMMAQCLAPQIEYILAGGEGPDP